MTKKSDVDPLEDLRETGLTGESVLVAVVQESPGGQVLEIRGGAPAANLAELRANVETDLDRDHPGWREAGVALYQRIPGQPLSPLLRALSDQIQGGATEGSMEDLEGLIRPAKLN